MSNGIGLTGIDALEAEMRDRLAAKDKEISRLRAALTEIANQDETELALDPDWARRVAKAALAGKDSAHV